MQSLRPLSLSRWIYRFSFDFFYNPQIHRWSPFCQDGFGLFCNLFKLVTHAALNGANSEWKQSLMWPVKHVTKAHRKMSEIERSFSRISFYLQGLECRALQALGDFPASHPMPYIFMEWKELVASPRRSFVRISSEYFLVIMMIV